MLLICQQSTIFEQSVFCEFSGRMLLLSYEPRKAAEFRRILANLYVGAQETGQSALSLYWDGNWVYVFGGGGRHRQSVVYFSRVCGRLQLCVDWTPVY
jgi:hypothetical protein